MSKEFFINKEFQETRVAVKEDNRLDAYYVERKKEKGIYGNIYKGKVETVIPGMQAAFVNLGLGVNGFLHISAITQQIYQYDDFLEKDSVSKKENENIDKLLKSGQEILVQIVREPIDTKGPQITTHVSLPGRYLVLMPFDSHIGISRRIKQYKRKYLRSVISSFNIPKEMGLIVRTSAREAKKREIKTEYKYLIKQWKKIDKKAKASKAPSLIHEERGLILRVMRDMLSYKVNKVFIDSKVEYKRCLHFLKKFEKRLRKKVRYYKGEVPIFEKFGLQKEIKQIYERKVVLDCGGYILIEPTESLVSIDVNSGGFVGKKSLEHTAFMVNIQAADEIIKQIKLRDLGGIIIVDFIDMDKPKHISQLLGKIKRLVKEDKSEVDFWYSSKAGLVEMTRQRGRKSIKSISYQECPYCEGRGVIKSKVTVGIRAVKKIKQVIEEKSADKIMVKLHPDIVKILLSEYRKELESLEYRNKVSIILKKIPYFHFEQIEIED